MDKYVVKMYDNGWGSYYYFKNGKLHREVGPAIVTTSDRDKFTHLEDENLYTKEIVNEPTPHKSVNRDDGSSFITFKGYKVAIYYLEGNAYTEKEFIDAKIKLDLKNDLYKELDTTNTNIKKPKI